MKEWLKKTIDEIVNQTLLLENPDTVKDRNGREIAYYSDGSPAIAFFGIKDDALGKFKWFINDQRNHGSAYHGDISRRATPDFPNPYSGDDRFFRGRIWTDKRICSWYRDEASLRPYFDKIEELFDQLKLNINDFKFEFGNSARTEGLKPWPGSGKVKKKEPELSPEDQKKVEEINKRIAELQATLHLKVGQEKVKVEQEIERLEKMVGKIGSREKFKTAYFKMAGQKLDPYEKGGGGTVAGYKGRLPAIAETIDEIINEIISENPDTVRDKHGDVVVDCSYGPAIPFKMRVDHHEDHTEDVYFDYEDGRGTNDATWHNDISMRSPGLEKLRGRIWTDELVCSFYQRESVVEPYRENIEKFFQDLGLDIKRYRFDYEDSGETEGLKPWKPASYKAPKMVIPPEIQKRINDLLPQFHLTTGAERDKIKQELDQIYKQLGIENAKEAEKIAYMKMSGERKSPYEKGGGAGIASYRGRLPALQEKKVRIYNKTLCPDLWNEQKQLDPEIRNTLLKIANDFYKDTELKAKIQDVYLLGSIANYNWTPVSDMDVHIVIDSAELSMHPENAEKFLRSLVGKWNLEHEIKIKNHKVELYLQDTREKNAATAIYSLGQGQWIKEPFPEDVQIDKKQIQKKYTSWTNRINDAIKREDVNALKKILEDLREYRQAGLSETGEFSTENLVFKILRSRGWIEKIKDSYNTMYDKKMTVADGFDPTSVGPNPEATEGESDGGSFYQSLNRQMRRMEEGVSPPILVLRKPGDKKGIIPLHASMLGKDHRAITIGNEVFGIPIRWPGAGNKWYFNAWPGAFKINFPSWKKTYNTPEEMVDDLNKYLDAWYEKKKKMKEGYGAGIPETDRLKIKKKGEPVRRWQIRSKDAPKTPKMTDEVVNVINEILEQVLPLPLKEGLILESPRQEKLKKNRKPLTDEERKQVMDAGAVWHHGPNGEETPAVWKSVVDGKTWYCCNTHRAIQIKPTLKGAIKAFEFIKTTA